MEVKTFMVTGGLGFIGSYFIDMLLREGHMVLNYDKVSYASREHSFNNHPNYTFFKQDIRTLKNLPSSDFIVNFAAESHVDNSIAESDEFISSNVLGVYNLLELIKNKKIQHMQKAWEYKIPIFVQISTDEVFGDVEVGSFSEDSRHKPSNPYAASKSAAEQLVFAWGRTYQIPFIITRTTNNYGSRQFPEKLIPKAITYLLKDQKIPVHGAGIYKRNWIHVEDNVEAIYTILKSGLVNTSFHIASEEEFSVKEIVSLVAQEFGKTFEQVADFSSDRSGADVRYALDYQKLSKLGWSPKRTLKKSLCSIIEYYRSLHDYSSV